MEPRPRVRVRWTRTAMQCVQDPVRSQVFNSLTEEGQRAIDEAGLLGWIDAEHHIALCVGWHDALGDYAFKTLFHDAFLNSVSGPLLGAIVKGSLRLFGNTPVASAKAWPVGWPHIFREGGAVETLEVGERNVTVRVFDLPPVMREWAFVVGCAGSYEGNATLVGEAGTATFDAAGLAEGEFTLSLVW